jgi:hypothetical protein
VYAHALAAFERLDWQSDQRVLIGITFRPKGLSPSYVPSFTGAVEVRFYIIAPRGRDVREATRSSRGPFRPHHFPLAELDASGFSKQTVEFDTRIS